MGFAYDELAGGSPTCMIGDLGVVQEWLRDT